jgi:hypothetical protein
MDATMAKFFILFLMRQIKARRARARERRKIIMLGKYVSEERSKMKAH